MKNGAGKRLVISALLPLVVGMIFFARPPMGETGSERVTFKFVHIEPFEPFAFVKEGRSEGLAVDILTEALARANVNVVFRGEHQDQEDDLLSKGYIDGIAFLGINPERRQTYDFSDPYLITGGALLVKSPNPRCSDLREFEGKTVATPEKGPLARYIQKRFSRVNILTDVKDYEETLKAVLDGKADAADLNTQVDPVLARRLFPGKFTLPEKGFLEVPIGCKMCSGEPLGSLLYANNRL